MHGENVRKQLYNAFIYYNNIFLYHPGAATSYAAQKHPLKP